MKKKFLLALMILSSSTIRSDLLILGTTVKTQEEAPIQSKCLICDKNTLHLFSLQRWFTFFFIPVLRPWDKVYYIGCLNCQQCYKLKPHINIKMLLDINFEGSLREIIKTSNIETIVNRLH